MNPSTQTLENKPIVHCLVIQMARLGDTIQSFMALRAAKQLYPELEIHFLCRNKFSAAAKRVAWIKEVITLPTEDILLPLLNQQKTESESIAFLRQWLKPLQKSPWDLVLNWSFSESSSFLTYLIPARIKLGYTRRPDGTLQALDGWSQYMQGIVQGKVLQNIHLTDILTTQLLTTLQIYSGPPKNEGNVAVTSKGFFSLLLNDIELKDLRNYRRKKCIAIQLGASQKSKTWSPQNWSQFILYLLRRHPDYQIHLLGGPEDKAAEEIIRQEISSHVQASVGVTSWVGRTTFDYWAALIGLCQWLISSDTAAIHLASVLGTRVFNLSFGSAHFNETGPYGNAHYIITSHQGVEINPEAAYATWAYANQDWSHGHRKITLETHLANLSWTEKLTSLQVYRAQIRGTDKGGGLYFEAINRKPLDIETWTSLVMGQIARAWYCGWTPPLGQELSREMINPALTKILRELKASTEVLTKIYEQAFQTALTLSQKGSDLFSDKVMKIQDREELNALGDTLLELDALVERLATTHPSLRGFCNMSKVLMHNLNGQNLREIGQETARCYKQLNEGVQLFQNWIQFSLELIKPVAIQPSQSVKKPQWLNI